MPQKEWMNTLDAALSGHLDDKKKAHFFTKILPNIVSDFNSMANGRSDGITISEEYKLDDGSFSVFLYGHVKNNNAVIERCEVEKQ